MVYRLVDDFVWPSALDACADTFAVLLECVIRLPGCLYDQLKLPAALAVPLWFFLLPLGNVTTMLIAAPGSVVMVSFCFVFGATIPWPNFKRSVKGMGVAVAVGIVVGVGVQPVGRHGGVKVTPVPGVPPGGGGGGGTWPRTVPINASAGTRDTSNARMTIFLMKAPLGSGWKAHSSGGRLQP
jgi:hypothetical protein